MQDLRKILIVSSALIGLSAVIGGIGLIATNGLGMPVSWLSNSPFRTFVWPGAILAFIVGGTHLAAAWLLYKKHYRALEALATAGFGMLIWIFVEIYLIGHTSLLQVLYFVFAILTLIAVMISLQLKANTHE